MPIEEFKNILIRKGTVKLYKIKYNKFKAHQGVDKKYVEEYIWLINTSSISSEITEIEIELIK